MLRPQPRPVSRPAAFRLHNVASVDHPADVLPRRERERARAVSGPQWQRPDLPSTSVAALHLLVTGWAPAAVARQQAMSLRLLEARLAATRHALGATTPYTLGMLAIRHRLVPATAPTDHARPRSQAADSTTVAWVEPTPVQQDILHLLAAGHSYAQTAAALDLSPRTVRRRFRALTAANGVDRPLPAGALFEALGWHDSPR